MKLDNNTKNRVSTFAEPLGVKYLNSAAYASLKIDEIRKMQGQAVEDDYRVGMIEAYIKNKDAVCILELWRNALDNQFSKPTRRESNEIALILQSFNGWVRDDKPSRSNEYGLQRFWHKTNEAKFEELPPIDVTDLPI